MEPSERLDRIEDLIRELKILSGSQPGAGAESKVRSARPRFPQLPVVEGVQFSAASAGIKSPGRPDVMLVRMAPNTQIAGVFTRSATRSAPVVDCERKMRLPSTGQGFAILANSGNANAFTGQAGFDAVDALASAVGEALGLTPEQVFTASTGVIGDRLPEDRIRSVIGGLAAGLADDRIEDAARAIMTTDSFAKGAGRSIDIAGGNVTISGIAKGSGMIAPDMGTMLAFIFTDARIGREPLRAALSDLVEGSFNSVTVDGDTSTSDTVIVAATGRSAAEPVDDPDSVGGRAFREALGGVMEALARQIARDGEGASKFVEIEVSGAADAADAERVAKSIANSPLVKTAIAGGDPNWGRIVMAVGKSGAEADRDRLTIRIGDQTVAERGQVAEGYSERQAAEYMSNEDIRIGVDLGIGAAGSRIWTCDLTADYVSINADYRS